MGLKIRNPYDAHPQYFDFGDVSSEEETQKLTDAFAELAKIAKRKANMHLMFSIGPYIDKNCYKQDPVYYVDKDQYGHEYVIADGLRISLTNFTKVKQANRILLYDKEDEFFGYINTKQ